MVIRDRNRIVATVRGQAVLASAVDMLGIVWLVLGCESKWYAKAKGLSRRPSGHWKNRCEIVAVNGTTNST